MELNDWLAELHWSFGMCLALFTTLVLYFVFNRKSELSMHAVQNTVATLTVTFLNMLVIHLYIKDLNYIAQDFYVSLSIPKLPADTWDNWPLWLVFVLAIIIKDFVDYWTHRLMHTKWGWPTHAAHHSDTQVNAFTGLRVHFLETIIMLSSYLVLLTWLQMPQTLPIVLLFYTLMSIYVHLDLDFDNGPLKYVLASPRFHRWHHADVPAAYGKNLANIVPLYDVMFGTYYVPGRCDAPMGAIKTGVTDKNAAAIYIYPFLEWGRLIHQTVTDWAKTITKRTSG